MTSDLSTSLSAVGLTENESKIYLVLLKESNLSATSLRKKTSLANSRVYASLDSLISKGLVTYAVTPSGRSFSAADPTNLLMRAEQQYSSVKSLIPQLKKLHNAHQSNSQPRSAIYEGVRGFENAFYRVADETAVGATISIIGFATQAYKNEQLRRMLNRVNKTFIAKKHKYRMIIDQHDNQYATDRLREGITDLRFMPRDFISPAGIDISENLVAIFIWGESPYAMVIEDKNVVQSFQAYFDTLWKTASPKLAMPKK